MNSIDAGYLVVNPKNVSKGNGYIIKNGLPNTIYKLYNPIKMCQMYAHCTPF